MSSGLRRAELCTRANSAALSWSQLETVRREAGRAQACAGLRRARTVGVRCHYTIAPDPPPTPMPPAGSVDEMARGPGVWTAVGRAACCAPTACRPPGQLPGPPRALWRAPPRNGDPPHAIRGCPGACEPCRPPPWSSSSLSTQRSGRPGLSPPRSRRENRRFSSCFPSVSQWGRRLVKAHCHDQITALKTLIDSLCFLYKSSCQI